MPERRIKLLCEGPHDHAFLETLAALGKLPKEVELPQRRFKPSGKDAIPDAVAANLRANMSTIVVRDYDALRGDEVARWLAREIRANDAPITPLSGTSDAHVISTAKPIVVIGVGCLGVTPSDIASAEQGTIDEYLLRLLLDRDVYERAPQIKECPYDTWRQKLVEARDLVVSNGLAPPTIKQLVRLPHLLTSSEGAPTTLTELALRAASDAGSLDRLSDPLRSAVVRAADHLLAK